MDATEFQYSMESDSALNDNAVLWTIRKAPEGRLWLVHDIVRVAGTSY